MILDFITRLNRRDVHPVIQFIKYGIAGGIATGVHIVCFFAASLWLFPALLPDVQPDAFLVNVFNVDMPTLEEVVRRRNFMINNGLAFILSNLTAYLINFHWVFHPGRHRRHIEVGLFFIVSGVSLVLGVQFGVLLMKYFDMTTTFSQVGNIAASILINYVCRKYIVFKG